MNHAGTPPVPVPTSRPTTELSLAQVLGEDFDSQVGSRRRFLERTALGVAGMALVGPVRAVESSVGRVPIPVGFLGTAYSHFKEKHALLAGNADFELVGCHEPDASVRASAAPGPRWIEESELLSRAKVVVVESALRDHARFARRALEAGCHVHVEKPPAATLAEFKDLIGLAREKKLILQVGYMWRYHPGIQRVLEAVREGWLGEVFLVRATMNTQVDAVRRKEWAEFRGGAMFEQGSHLIDATVRLMGVPKRVNSYLQQTRPEQDGLSDNTVAVLEYAKAMAIITSAPLQPNAGGHRYFEVLGTNGLARVQPIEPGALEVDLGKAAGPYRVGRQMVTLPQYRRYVDEFVDLAAAVRGERVLPFTETLELQVQSTLMQVCQQ